MNKPKITAEKNEKGRDIKSVKDDIHLDVGSVNNSDVELDFVKEAKLYRSSPKSEAPGDSSQDLTNRFVLMSLMLCVLGFLLIQLQLYKAEKRVKDIEATLKNKEYFIHKHRYFDRKPVWERL